MKVIVTICGVLSLWVLGMLALAAACNPAVRPGAVAALAGFGFLTIFALIIVGLRK